MISAEEVRMIQVLTEAIFPGAVEARVYEFIIRDTKSNPVMVGWYQQALKQLNDGAEHLYRTNIVGLSSDQLDGLLARYESSPFFQFIKEQTLEGMFSDPIYGGNYKAFGWRLLGYEGATFHPPETIDVVRHPTVYYSLEGIAYEEKNGL